MVESKKRISLFVIVLINIFFLIKYVERVSEYYLIIALMISYLYYQFFHFRNTLKIKESYKKILFYSVIISYVLISIKLFDLIPQSTLNVDRYSVITSFWDSFFNSEYAFAAKSSHGNMPGPMPFYFILSLPFYWIGELGYFSLSGLIVFAVILKYSKLPENNKISGLLLITGSAFFLWEIISRSNIFMNSAIALLSILFFLESMVMKRIKHIFINGVIIGLILSTRNVLLLPFIILFLYLLKNKMYLLSDFLKLGVVILLTFITTFLPFIMDHFPAFLEINPFIIQSSYLMPSWLTLICILITFSSFFLLKRKEDIFFFSGIFLFITILIYFIYQVFINGIHATLFGSKADISYFILCVPFLLYFILFETDSNKISEEQNIMYHVDTIKHTQNSKQL